LMVFYKGLSSLAIPGALGWAIILMTFTIRGALSPLTNKQMESAQKMQSLKPHLDELQKKHGKDKKKYQEEQLKLFQQHGVNPAAGCLPTLIQFPFIIALYQMFFRVLTNGNLQETVDSINKIVYTPFLRIEALDLSFFGLNLAVKPSAWREIGWWLLLIPVITGVLQWIQTKQLAAQQMPTTAPVQSEKKDKKKESDMVQDLQKQMMLMMPVMIGIFSYQFPVGLSLYWNTFTLLSLKNKKKTNILLPAPAQKKA
ncbi:YidC/Oxa1 family membrane protein insertase, partial [Candidatus Roizmanbacteria bacterium]|nr:YidC/Oxa1 family membrane protein insertase [Candidatus Roizmanbacteria bacterium]